MHQGWLICRGMPQLSKAPVVTLSLLKSLNPHQYRIPSHQSVTPNTSYMSNKDKPNFNEPPHRGNQEVERMVGRGLCRDWVTGSHHRVAVGRVVRRLTYSSLSLSGRTLAKVQSVGGAQRRHGPVPSAPLCLRSYRPEAYATVWKQWQMMKQPI